jgi:hypothetical protein
MSVNTANIGGVPPALDAVAANVTVTDTTGFSFLTAWPDGVGQPNASDLNWTPGKTIPNAAILTLSPEGVFDLYNQSGSTDAIVDIAGWFSPPVPSS